MSRSPDTSDRRQMPLSASGWVDVSVPILDGMVHWPDNPPIIVERMMDMDRGADANVSRISLGVHTGTHVDAPVHFLRGAAGVDGIPLDALLGRARVIEIGDPGHITVATLHAADVRAGERILLKTRNSSSAWQRSPAFVEDAVHLSIDAARYLAETRVLTVGIDYLSVGGYAANNGVAVHHALIEAGIWIIEGLDLSRATTGPCELICLPLKLVGCDGAPARALVRAIRGEERA